MPCHLTISDIKIPDVLMMQNRLKKKKKQTTLLEIDAGKKGSESPALIFSTMSCWNLKDEWNPELAW